MIGLGFLLRILMAAAAIAILLAVLWIAYLIGSLAVRHFWDSVSDQTKDNLRWIKSKLPKINISFKRGNHV